MKSITFLKITTADSATTSKRNKFSSGFKFLSMLILVLLVSGKSWGATPYTMSSGNYSEGFADIANWTNNFAAGTGASYWESVGVIGSGTSVTTGVRTTKSSVTFVATTAGGIQRGTQALIFLSTGSTSPPEAVAVDLLLDFTGRTAGTLSFDWSAIDNGNGTRPTSLRVFWSTDGSTFTEITAAQVLDKTSSSTGSITTVTLPTEFNNNATSRLRFYNHAGTIAGSGSRDKISIDNIAITSTPTSNVAPTVTTQAPTSITTSAATGNGNITATGGVNPTVRGICWDLAANADPDINDSKVEETGAFSTGAFTGSLTSLTAGTQYKVRAYATNTEGISYGSVQTFYTLSSEPTAHASSFTASAISQIQIDLSFDAASTITNAAGYLILQRTGAAPTGAPADATTYTVGNSIGDGTVAALITNTADVTKSITGLSAGTQYYFTLFPYSGSGTSINYKTDGSVPGANATTLAPLATTSEVSGPALGSQPNPTSISSLITTDGAAVRVFDMDIYDYAVDTDPTKVTQLTIKAGTNNTANWSNTIQGVKLSTDAGATFVTLGTPTITASSIVIPITSGNLNIPNNDALTVSLYVYLKSTGITDNQILEFKVDATAASHGFTADATGSTFLSTFASAPVSNQILVDVVATKLAFVQQPTNVGTSVNITPAVTVSANDVNENRDLDYVTNVSVSATGLTGSPVSVTPISGLTTFSSLSFASAATGITMSASSGLLTEATSNSFDVLLLPAAGEIVINQISPDYSGASNEYIELVNRTNKTFDLSQLKIEYQSSGGTIGGAGGNLTGSLGPYQFWLLSPDATITVGQTTSLARDGSITAGFAASAAQIALRLKNSPNTIIDGIAYGTVSPNNLGEGTSTTSPPADGGLKRVQDGIDNNANSTDFETVTQANIYLRNSNSLCIANNYVLPATSYPADVVISGSSPAVTLTGNTTVTGKLTILSGSLSIASNQYMTVTGALTNNGTLNLLSSLSGTATLKAPASISGSGSYTVQQYLTNQSWYLTSPVWDGVSMTNSVTPTNLSRIQGYIEGSGTGNVWSVSGTTMVPLKGYITSVSSAPNTVVFTGTINTGNISIPLTRQAAGNENKYGFNLIGNPYTAYLDWNAVATANAAKMPTATMWYRTKVSGGWAFTTVNGTVASPDNASYLIPPMQAFWVRASGVGSTTLDLTNNMVLQDNNSSNKLKAPAASNADRQIVRLQVSNATNTDELVIYTDAQALNTFDTYDSPKMSNESADIPEISSIVGAENLVINGLNNLILDTALPINFMTKTANTFSIKVIEFKNVATDIRVVLRDNLLNVEQDLTDGSAYNFSAGVTNSATRFAIIFKSSSTPTGLENNAIHSSMVYRNANNQLIVSSNGTEGTIIVSNAIGQGLLNTPITGTSTLIAKPFGTGVYFVTVKVAGTSKTHKVIFN